MLFQKLSGKNISFARALWAWGRNNYGNLGLGDTNARSSPVQVGQSGELWSVVVASANHSLAIKTDGTLSGWGQNSYGQLGLGHITHKSSPVQVGTLATWGTVSIGNHSLAIKTDGTLWTWGNASYGQLGSGATALRSSPVQVGTLAVWSKVAANGQSSFVTKTDGTLWTWGYNSNGLLGLTDKIHRSSQ